MSKEEKDLTEEELEQAVGGRKRRRAREGPKVLEPAPEFPRITGVEPLADPPYSIHEK